MTDLHKYRGPIWMTEMAVAIAAGVLFMVTRNMVFLGIEFAVIGIYVFWSLGGYSKFKSWIRTQRYKKKWVYPPSDIPQ